MYFSFAGGVQSAQGLCSFPRGWVRESRVVHDAPLFILQIHRSSFGACWWGEMLLLFFSMA
jgi:hypothetical protein